MRIVIIGAGIAGLSSYLFLVKHLLNDIAEAHTICIYEAYDIRQDVSDHLEETDSQSDSESTFASKAIGNAIGLGKNGLAVLSRIGDNGEVLRRVQNMGQPVAKWKMGTARGWTIANANVTSPSQDDKGASIADTVMVARQVVWEILRDEVLKHNREAVRTRKVIKTESLQNGKVLLEFQDGSGDTADVLIGADGLRSIVRRTMFENSNDFETQTWPNWLFGRPQRKKDYITPHYEGLTGLGGFVPSEVLEQSGFQAGSMAITFGPNGFFGHGYIGDISQRVNTPTKSVSRPNNVGPVAAWWSTFSSPTPNPFQIHDTPNITASTPGIKTTFDKIAALASLLDRHKSWSDPTIKAILAYVSENRTIEHTYPTYTTPELPTWTNHPANTILIGDAAHALQPSSGQGACQALEDAESLALFLSHYLRAFTCAATPSTSSAAPQLLHKRQAAAVSTALTSFVRFRKPRLAKIYKQSQRMSSMKADMNLVQEYVMYGFIWLATKLPMWKRYNEELFEYDLPRQVRIAVAEGVIRGCEIDVCGGGTVEMDR